MSPLEKHTNERFTFVCSEENTSVTVGVLPEENRCVVCHEDLTPFYHEESEEWHLKDAVRVEGITYHRLCYRDHLSTQVLIHIPRRMARILLCIVVPALIY